MSHARSQIRAGIVALLTGLVTTSNRVFQSRMRPQSDASLPCLLITTNDEQIDSSVDGILTRNLTLSVRGIAKGSTTLDATLDQIALEVESIMATEHKATFDRLEIDFEDGLEKTTGSITLHYQYQYFTAADNPAVMI